MFVTNYLTRWAKADSVIFCSSKNVAQFLFDNVVMRFGCSRILMGDQGTYFLNKMTVSLTEEFHI